MAPIMAFVGRPPHAPLAASGTDEVAVEEFAAPTECFGAHEAAGGGICAACAAAAGGGRNFAAVGATMSLAVKCEIKGKVVPLPPCLDEECECFGVFYKEVCTTSSRIVATLTMDVTDCSAEDGAEVLARFKETVPAVIVSYKAPEGDVTIVTSTAADFAVDAKFDHATTSWRLAFRPNITAKREQALCRLVVRADGANAVEAPIEIRSKPSAWLVVENVPEDWNMARLEQFLTGFVAREQYKQIRCAVHTPHTAFVQLARRSLAPAVMEAWLRASTVLHRQAPAITVSWALNVNRAFAAGETPFAPGTGWKAPHFCRRAPVLQLGAKTKDVKAADKTAAEVVVNPAGSPTPNTGKRGPYDLNKVDGYAAAAATRTTKRARRHYVAADDTANYAVDVCNTAVGNAFGTAAFAASAADAFPLFEDEGYDDDSIMLPVAVAAPAPGAFSPTLTKTAATNLVLPVGLEGLVVPVPATAVTRCISPRAGGPAEVTTAAGTYAFNIVEEELSDDYDFDEDNAALFDLGFDFEE